MIQVNWVEGNGLYCACCRLCEDRAETHEELDTALTRAADLVAFAQHGHDISYIQIWDGDKAVGTDNRAFERRVRWSLRRMQWEESCDKEECTDADDLPAERGCDV